MSSGAHSPRQVEDRGLGLRANELDELSIMCIPLFLLNLHENTKNAWKSQIKDSPSKKKLLQAYNEGARKLRDIPVERAPLCAPEVAARFVWHVSLQRALSFHSQLFYAPVLPALPISAQFLAVFLTGGGGKSKKVLKLKAALCFRCSST